MDRFWPAVALIAVPSAIFAQSSTFDLVFDNKLVGQDTYTVAKGKQGYKLVSKLRYNVHASEGDLTDEFKYNNSYAYQEGSITANDTQVLTSYTLGKGGTEVSVGRVQGPLHDTTFFEVKDNFVLLPPFDAGAIQVLLLQAGQASAPTAFNVYAPSAGGRGQGPAGSSPALEAHWTKGPDVTGTLQGKTLTLHSFVLSSPRFRWELLVDDAHALMQCDLPVVKTRYIRHGFKQDPSAQSATPSTP